MAGTGRKVKKRRGLRTAAIVFAALLLILTVPGVIFTDNKNIDYENFYLKYADTGSDIKIIHLSDMHFPQIKVDLDKLLAKTEAEKPDLVAITGDLIDGAKIESSGVYDFIDKLKTAAPVFYVSGNHEGRTADSYKLYDYLSYAGVTILNNRSVNLNVRGKEITVIGLTDNTDYNELYLADNPNAAANYKILLAHRPEKWPLYSSSYHSVGPDLVLSGHAHGGQIRIFKQGLIAPNQGLFPKYDSGLYQTEYSSASMIVSRGIGNSLFPFRINNKPHVPIITISL